jgi:hypothetical protein
MRPGSASLTQDAASTHRSGKSSVHTVGGLVNPHEAAYDSDEEKKFQGRKPNILALDKWTTDKLLVLKNAQHIVHPDGCAVKVLSASDFVL